MNGNCVLVPHEIAQVVGNLEAGFAHAMGDTDYGLRTRKAGFKLWISSSFVGTCETNSAKGAFNDPALPLSLRWDRMMQPKGLPLASWWLFTSRHGGLLWPLYFVWPYLRVVFR
jgi:GT2 family glycosyltransferase